MTLTRDESGFRHRLRVRLGANGPLGRLLKCEKKDKSGWYWKVKLDSGEWVWPADLHVDGQGALVQHCRECRLPFLGDGIKDFCYRCNEELFGVVPPVTERADYQGTRPRGPARR
jgi:hypothetical protein